MKRAGLWLATPLVAVMIVGGCASAPPRPAASAPPWMARLPEERGGVFYQVGTSLKTFYEKDAIDRAYEDGVEKLAKRLKVDVKSFRLEVETGGKGSGEHSERTITASSEVADVAIYGAEQVGHYIDRDGLFGPQDMAYVLVRWSEGMMKQQMERLLKKENK